MTPEEIKAKIAEIKAKPNLTEGDMAAIAALEKQLYQAPKEAGNSGSFSPAAPKPYEEVEEKMPEAALDIDFMGLVQELKSIEATYQKLDHSKQRTYADKLKARAQQIAKLIAARQKKTAGRSLEKPEYGLNPFDEKGLGTRFPSAGPD